MGKLDQNEQYIIIIKFDNPVHVLGSVTYHAFYNNMQLVLTAVRAIRGNQKWNSHESVLKLKLSVNGWTDA